MTMLYITILPCSCPCGCPLQRAHPEPWSRHSFLELSFAGWVQIGEKGECVQVEEA